MNRKSDLYRSLRMKFSNGDGWWRSLEDWLCNWNDRHNIVRIVGHIKNLPHNSHGDNSDTGGTWLEFRMLWSCRHLYDRWSFSGYNYRCSSSYYQLRGAHLLLQLGSFSSSSCKSSCWVSIPFQGNGAHLNCSTSFILLELIGQRQIMALQDWTGSLPWSEQFTNRSQIFQKKNGENFENQLVKHNGAKVSVAFRYSSYNRTCRARKKNRQRHF